MNVLPHYLTPTDSSECSFSRLKAIFQKFQCPGRRDTENGSDMDLQDGVGSDLWGFRTTRNQTGATEAKQSAFGKL